MSASSPWGGYGNAVLWHRQGDTFSWAGVVTLPGTGTWSALCALRDLSQPQTATPAAFIATTLTLTGPNTANPLMNDYTLVLSATAAETLAWTAQNTPASPLPLTAAIKFFDNSTPVNEMTTRPFTVNLTYDLVPHA